MSSIEEVVATFTSYRGVLTGSHDFVGGQNLEFHTYNSRELWLEVMPWIQTRWLVPSLCWWPLSQDVFLIFLWNLNRGRMNHSYLQTFKGSFKSAVRRVTQQSHHFIFPHHTSVFVFLNDSRRRKLGINFFPTIQKKLVNGKCLKSCFFLVVRMELKITLTRALNLKQVRYGLQLHNETISIWIVCLHLEILTPYQVPRNGTLKSGYFRF
jgi:hypothetical protein